MLSSERSGIPTSGATIPRSRSIAIRISRTSSRRAASPITISSRASESLTIRTNGADLRRQRSTRALRAYEKSLQGKPRQTVDGFTPEQRFFLGFAQVWGENSSLEQQTRAALTDPHAQGRFRVNGTVQNMPAFAQAFHCAEGSKMVRDASKRCAIW